MSGRGSRRYKEWRKKVLERDGYKCVKCEKTEHLHCDHIIPWKGNEELRFDVSNGQTLCAGCHLKKGRENKEIDGTKTQFKKDTPSWNKGKKGCMPIPWNKGKKTDLIPWNKGKKGVMPEPWNKGKELSEETKLKISQSKKGQTPWMKGKTHTEETKLKISEINKGKRRIPNTEFQKGERRSQKTEFKKGMVPWNKKDK